MLNTPLRHSLSCSTRHPLAAAMLAATAFTLASPAVQADTGRYRLAWRDDPATTMVIAWEQRSGGDATVHYGPEDKGREASAYPSSRGPDRRVNAMGMENRFVRLTGLEPDTAYYFVIKDSASTSPRFWFRTAPNTPKPFTLIAGGDTRNNRLPRRRGNHLVAQLRPLGVMLGGDFTDSNSSSQWQEWMDDWQETISEDGRMYPMIAARGNHDSDSAIHDLWDTPDEKNYFSLAIGGSLASIYTLNSETGVGGTQTAWLQAELKKDACTQFKLAQYHKPMRPHQSGKGEGNDEYDNWAKPFFDHGLDLVVECDSHTVKRTWPVRPDPGGDEGFVRDDTGTTYIGEGCWGAPLRSNDDNKSWTRDSGRFNELNWLKVHLDRIEVSTVLIDKADDVQSVSDANPLAAPQGLELWNAKGGAVVTLNARSRKDGAGNACPPVRAEEPDPMPDPMPEDPDMDNMDPDAPADPMVDDDGSSMNGDSPDQTPDDEDDSANGDELAVDDEETDPDAKGGEDDEDDGSSSDDEDEDRKASDVQGGIGCSHTPGAPLASKHGVALLLMFLAVGYRLRRRLPRHQSDAKADR